MDEESSLEHKRLRAEDEIGEEHSSSEKDEDELEDMDEMDDDHCSICLQLFTNRSILIDCAHEFCFECIIKWTGMYSTTQSIVYNV